LDRRYFIAAAVALGLGLPSVLTSLWYLHDDGVLTRNTNGDFCYADLFWHPEHEVTELGYRHGLPDTKWWYKIQSSEYGEIWIDNPNQELWDHVSLVQYSFQFPPKPQWTLANNHLTLDAEVMVPKPDAPYTPDPSTSWSRVAIAFQLKRTDGLNYVLEEGKEFTELYSEFDVYRHNAKYFHFKGSNVYEYPADQLKPGDWRLYHIDLNDFFKNGYGNLGGWPDELIEFTYLSAWYLVVEVLGSRMSAAWKNIALRNWGR
jgi:hypothetical protein